MSTHRWRWSKPVRWADIVRSNLMTYGISSNETRKLLMQGVQNGRVIQVARGLYRLAQMPDDRESVGLAKVDPAFLASALTGDEV